MAMFCEGNAYHSEAPETLRSADALLHATATISLYDKLGQPYPKSELLERRRRQ